MYWYKKYWLAKWVEVIDKDFCSKIGTFGVKFKIFVKLFNWFSIWIIYRSNFKLLTFVWLDDEESKFWLAKLCWLNDATSESIVYEELSRLHE